MRQFRFCLSIFRLTGILSFLMLFSQASAQSAFPPGLEPECPLDCELLASAGVTEVKVEVSTNGERYLRNYCRLNGKGQVLENVVYFADGSVNYRKEYFWEKGRLQGTMVTKDQGNQYVHYLGWEKKRVVEAYKEPSTDGARLFFEYNSQGLLLEIRKGTVRDDSNPIRVYQYDEQGNLLLDSVLAGPSRGVVKHLRYNEQGQLVHDDQVSYREGMARQGETDYTYTESGLLKEEKIGGPANGGIIHRFEYDAQGRTTREQWLDLEGNLAEQIEFQYAKDGSRTDSRIYRGEVGTEPFAVGYEKVNGDGLPLEISLKEKDGGHYLWFYEYEK